MPVRLNQLVSPLTEVNLALSLQLLQTLSTTRRLTAADLRAAYKPSTHKKKKKNDLKMSSLPHINIIERI